MSIEQHIEELRAELSNCRTKRERGRIMAELAAAKAEFARLLTRD